MTGFIASRINTIPGIAMLTPIVLDATTESVTVIVPSGILTTNPDYTIDYIETTVSTYEEFSNDGTLAGSGAETTLVAAPASGVKRIITSFRINNRDSVQQVIQLNVKNGANTRRVWTGILKTSETLTPNGVFDFGGNIKTAGSGGGSGGVTSVGLSLPAEFTVSGSPIVSSGTLAAIWAAVAANKFLGGPTTGAAATPSFRVLDGLDFANGGFGSIADSELLGAAASFDFTNIPQTFKHLFVICSLRGDQATTSITNSVRLSNVSSANYFREQVQASATTVTGAESIGATSAILGDSPAGTATAGIAGKLVIFIPDYAEATLKPGAVFLNVGLTAGGSGNTFIRVGGFVLNVAGAVTQFTLTPSAGNWATDSRVTLYGMG